MKSILCVCYNIKNRFDHLLAPISPFHRRLVTLKSMGLGRMTDFLEGGYISIVSAPTGISYTWETKPKLKS